MSSPEPTPYAYLRWACSACGGEPIEAPGDGSDLYCETCGYRFSSDRGGRAELVPEQEGDDE